MLAHLCDHCDQRIGPRVHLKASIAQREEEFCSVPCLLAWGEIHGLVDPPEPAT